MTLSMVSLSVWAIILFKFRSVRYVALLPFCYSAFVILFNVAVFSGGISPVTLNLLSNVIRIFGVIASSTIAIYLWKTQGSL